MHLDSTTHTLMNLVQLKLLSFICELPMYINNPRHPSTAHEPLTHTAIPSTMSLY
ncbi:hypothetical protein P691DRAFT_174158 [Macrolepiota fuliginosa MF-IS2]|uniref:Uncharacterized protein n=1 Tax=Macrolepiota fuliginosa MF-IS2 TaxID=1400762 RepID=A0A9P5WYG6_9AGAR|nr:hypothetical protein P691DRAFT_174158 [Macrolepiota fuliginosa MF-IS2]